MDKDDRTKSEELFEQLCSDRGVCCERIPASQQRTADYKVRLGSTWVVVEIKQLDPGPDDRQLEELWGKPESPGAVAPVSRVRGLIKDGYGQVKASSEGKVPGLVIVFNNSGAWNWIDDFTVSTAMFGKYGHGLGLDSTTGEVVHRGAGHMGDRLVAESTLRSLSGVGVLDKRRQLPAVTAYHNPFTRCPIDPALMALLAELQFRHPDPHGSGDTHWMPIQVS